MGGGGWGGFGEPRTGIIKTVTPTVVSLENRVAPTATLSLPGHSARSMHSSSFDQRNPMDATRDV